MAIRWFGIRCAVLSNQNDDIRLSTSPFSGMPVGSTTSKAEILSEATISSVSSSRLYVSRTFPRYIRLGKRVSINASIHSSYFSPTRSKISSTCLT